MKMKRKVIIRDGGKEEEEEKNKLNNLLVTACEKSNHNLIVNLVNNGADVNSKDALSPSPLHICCFNGNVESTEFLLKNHPKVDALYQGRTPLITCILSEHINLHKKLKIINLLLENGANIHKFSEEGFNAFHYACMSCQKEISEVLLKKDPSIIDSESINPDASNLTPLLLILSYVPQKDCFYGIIELLLKNNADVNKVNRINGNSALHLAILHKKPKILELLLSKKEIDLNILNMILLLLKKEGVYVNIKDCFNQPPIYYVLLSLQNKCGPDHKKISTFLHEDPILSSLLKKGSDLNLIENEIYRQLLSLHKDHRAVTEYTTTFHLISKNGDLKILNEFTKTAEKFNLKADIYIKDEELNTPLQIACEKENASVFINLFEIIQKDENICRHFLDKNKKGDNLLTLAEKCRNEKIKDVISSHLFSYIVRGDLKGFLTNLKKEDFRLCYYEYIYQNFTSEKREEFFKGLVKIMPSEILKSKSSELERKISISNSDKINLKQIDSIIKIIKTELDNRREEIMNKLEALKKKKEEDSMKAGKELINQIEKEDSEKIRKQNELKVVIEKSSSPSPAPSPPTSSSPPLSPTPSPSPPPPRPLSPPPISSLSSVFSSVSLTKTSDDKRDREREKRVLDELHNYNDKEKEYETYSKNIEEVRSKESECKELINTFDIKRGELSSHALESTIENYNSNNFLLNLNKDITTLKKTYCDKKKELDRLIPAGENLLNKLKLNETYYVYNPKPCQYSNEKQTCGSLNLNIKIKPDKENEIKIHGLFPDEAETDKRNTFDDTRKKLFDKFYKEYRIGKDIPELYKHFSNYNHLDYKRIYDNNFFNFFTTKEDFIASFMWHLKFSNQNVLLFLNNILWLSDAIIITLSKDTQVFSEKDPASLNKKVNDLLSHQLGKDFFYSDIGEDDIVVNGKVVGKEFQIKLYFHLCYNDEINNPKWQFCKKDYKFQNINADAKASFKSSIKSRTMKSEDGKKSVRRKSARIKSVRRKSNRIKSVRRKSVRRKSLRRKSIRRKSLRRKSVRRKSVRRKSVRRKSNRRK